MSTPRTIYLAGELFSAKHLLGNAALGREIAHASGGRFVCTLPQDLPQSASARDIRDQDLRALLACDAAIFHYDGLELDSGTVVEYLVAKFADIPSVLVRTDFRHGGDQKDGDPWNLMNSFYPRTSTVWINSMDLYQESLRSGGTAETAAAHVIRTFAQSVCAALDGVMAVRPSLPRELGPAVYEWLALMPAFGNQEEAAAQLSQLYRSKVEKGLL